MRTRLSLLGSGWVTPLGHSIPDVLAAVRSGAQPEISWLELSGHRMPAFRVAETDIDVTFPRLRRSGRISRMALAAAEDAVAGLSREDRARLAIVFATTDGGVEYTRRFYQGILADHPGAGSPLLFPETVYNAAASHIAAWCGSDHDAETLVGDATASISALAAAGLLLAAGHGGLVLVVSANECDPVTALAYSRAGVLKSSPEDSAGNIFSDGAAAVVVGRPSPGSILLDVSEEPAPPLRDAPGAGIPDLRARLGEAFACTILQQVIAAAALAPSGPAWIASVGLSGGTGSVEVSRP